MKDYKIPAIQKTGFLLAGGGSTVVFNLTTILAMLFFTDLMGLSPAAVGTMLLISKIIDAVFDPACGAMIDRTNTRFGKVKPWVFTGAIATFVFGILMFVVPGFSDGGKLVYAFVTYNGVNIAFAACSLGMLTLMPLITKSQLERVSLSAFQFMGQTAFAIATTVAVMPLITYFSVTAPLNAYWKTGLIMGGVGMVAVLFFVFVVKEPASATSIAKKEKMPIKASLVSLVKNKYFLLLALVTLINGVAIAMHNSSMAQYLIYGLKKPELASVLMPLIYVGSFVAAILSKPLARFDKIRIIKFAFILIFAGLALRFFTGDTSLGIVIGGELAVGLGGGFVSVYLVAMLMDTIEYGYRKTKLRNDGLIMSSITFQQKIGQGIGIALMGYWLEFSGYIGGAEEQPRSASDALFNIHLLPFLIAAAVAFLILQFYKLDRKAMEKIIGEIAADAEVAEGSENTADARIAEGSETE